MPESDHASLLSRIHWTGSFATASIAAVMIVMAALAMTIDGFELRF